MSQQPPHDLIAALEAGRQDVASAALGMTDEQAKLKPAPDRWSVLDALEHLTVVEERFLIWVESGKPMDAPNPDLAKESSLKAMMADRSSKREAPEAVVPSGRFPTVAAALAQFHTMRDRAVQMATERGAELYAIGAQHPRFGLMNGVETLHLAAGHASRHAAQMREARAVLGF
ncbi:MAG: DinB family protein [Acidobacteriota bacterium]